MTSALPPFAVLIPSKGRADQWRKTLDKMPFLNCPDVFLGVETKERAAYLDACCAAGPWRGRIVTYDNPAGSVAVAREHLRVAAMEFSYGFFVVTDDNARYTQESLANLVGASRALNMSSTLRVMAGYHNTAVHFDRGKIKYATTTQGYRTYPSVAMIFQCYPRELYEAYTYPPDSYGLDDRHFSLWALTKGAEFRVCMDAPFTKTRYQAGGQGPLDARAMKTGLAIARLATDFPNLVGAVGTLRIPWQFLLDARAAGQMTGTRLVGGAMRKERDLQRPTVVVRVRRKK